MKKRLISLTALAALLLSMAGGIITVPTDPDTAKAVAKPSVSADSAIVMDVQSGTILYEKNIDKKQYPASITKIMTTLIALENSSLDETVTFSKNSVDLIQGQGASNIAIVPGEKLSMEDSLYAIMLMSANEVCNGVAEHVAGSIKAFVKMMNKRAKELGCTGTHFHNVNGLWEKNHYTTAHDMALISRAAYKNKAFARITGTKRYLLPKTNKRKAGYPLHNHHGMLLALKFPQYEYKYCVGGKTGYTSACRYTLVTYAKKKKMTILSVIMRAPDPPYVEPNEYTDSIALLNYGLNNFKRYAITDKDVSDVNTEKLFTNFSPFYNTETSSLYVEEDAGVLLPKGVKLKDAKKNIEYFDEEKTDESGNKAIGQIRYTYDGKDVGGTYVYYKNRGTPTLTDSINMTQWFDEAVEKATEKPFPWWLVVAIIVVVLLIGGGIFFIFPVIIQIRENRNRTKRYRKNRKNEQRLNSFKSTRRKPRRRR
ncbi:MAG: D-alanyl-D-alanine carboxypeptidase [Eubacterium sp.]|nr:D-alanyl-D-alanine carboxypeptidase [Eubacterium sp.]